MHILHIFLLHINCYDIYLHIYRLVLNTFKFYYFNCILH